MSIKRTENIRIRMTPQEKQYLLDEMQKTGETVLSKHLRKKVLNSQIEAKRQKNLELEQLSYEIRKIGVNINQIAKRYNSGTPFYTDPVGLLEYMKHIEELLQAYMGREEE